MVVGSLMFFAGLAGAYLSHRGLIAKGEPRTVLQVGWAAIYCSGLTAFIAAGGG